MLYVLCSRPRGCSMSGSSSVCAEEERQQMVASLDTEDRDTGHTGHRWVRCQVSCVMCDV